MGDYKYKGSEVDRNFSIKNLQRTLQQQQVKQTQQLHFPIDTNNVFQQVKNDVHRSLENNLISELTKPELNYGQVLDQLLNKKRKKKSKRFHL